MKYLTLTYCSYFKRLFNSSTQNTKPVIQKALVWPSHHLVGTGKAKLIKMVIALRINYYLGLFLLNLGKPQWLKRQRILLSMQEM